MRLRLGKDTDVPAMASMSARAFDDEPIWNWANPSRDQYPDGWVLFFSGLIRKASSALGSQTVVAEIDDEEGKIVGFTMWERKGESAEAKGWQKNSVAETSLNHSGAKEYDDALPACCSEHNLKIITGLQTPFDHIKDRWHVALNVVDLQYQRCGIGSQLLQWGLTHAQNESVPVTVKSSKRAQRVYRRNGFREIGCLQVADNVEGYAMLWESIPRGCKSA